jgi:hypothetical protein
LLGWWRLLGWRRLLCWLGLLGRRASRASFRSGLCALAGVKTPASTKHANEIHADILDCMRRYFACMT